MLYKSFGSISRNLLLLSLLAAPVWAQFEINPDHFDNPDSTTASALQTDVRAQLSDLQAQLRGYQAQLKATSDKVEEVREEAISAGIQGDGAGSYIEAYRQQQKQFRLLQESLSAQIQQVRNTIAGLQARVILASVETRSPRSIHRPGRLASASMRRPWH